MRAVAIVDGEHYAAVVRHALSELPYDFAAAVLVGGQEKLRGGEDYGVPLVEDVESAIARHAPDVVVDLSDEPVLGPPERLALVSRVLACGVPYVGADFRFDPPQRAPFECRRSRSSGRGSVSARPLSPGISRGCSRPSTRSSSSRWGAEGRPTPR